jgi:flagellar basal-body rod protein FlgG
MMRSLWTAASGMTSQQQNVNVISHNLANVNTYGYKKERLEFKSLMYETLQRADRDPANQGGRPVNLQVGHGVRPIATSRLFTTGSFQTTDNALDFAIEGKAFFAVQRGEEVYYTRDGAFKLSVNDDGTFGFVTAEGYPVLTTDGDPVEIPEDISLDRLIVEPDGRLMYIDAESALEDLGIQIELVQFSNPQGLEAIGSNLYALTPASGEPISESAGETMTISQLRQGVLEMSNVQIAEEMVNLIVAQRAYELNSKAISTSDDMLNTANNLKR